VHAAYAVQSGEPMANLFAGEYPLLPFFTDTEHRLEIEARPWYDSACNAVWVFQTVEITWQDVFFRPVWKALPGSEICHDVAFTRSSEASLRVMSEDGSADLGVSVSAYKYNRLDLRKYAGLSVDLYNAGGVTTSLALETEDDEVLLVFSDEESLGNGWVRRRVFFEDLPEGEIRRIRFEFDKPEGEVKYVNLERVRLLTK